jgi:hypothetical protein
MRRKAACLAILCALLAVLPPVPAGGAPVIEVASPANNAVLLSKTVNVTGTASGSEARWSQAAAADFSAGTASAVTIGANGTVYLGEVAYDDFNDDSIDPARWTKQETAGLTLAEENGRLHVYGNPATMAWAGAGLRSTATVREVSADLVGFSGSGNSFGASLGLWQDDQNSIVISEHYDWTWGYRRLAVAWNLGGVQNELFFGNLESNPVPHNFKASYSGGTITFYMDNSSVYSKEVSFASPVIALWNSAVDQSRIDALWDNVVTPSMAGNFTSSVFDTRCGRPVLVNVSWSPGASAGASLKIYVRSASGPEMDDASDWDEVSNGQASGLPAAGRYLQYRASFSRKDFRTPVLLDDVAITYFKPVAAVEVSADNQATWMAASGTGSWSAILGVLENVSVLHARVTDAAGETRVASVNIQVDTTPPAGAIQINGGDAVTWSPAVSLRLDASDRFGVASMKVGESFGLEGAQWRPYTARLDWNLSAGPGEKTVYARFRDANGWESALVCDTIRLVLARPSVRIDRPSPNETVRGRLTVSGTASCSEANRSLTGVMVQIDDQGWEDANGTASWSFGVDTKGLANGRHTVRARATDGAADSEAAELSFMVRNSAGGDSTVVDRLPPALLALVAVLVAAGVAIAYWLGRRRRGPAG